MTLTFYMDEHIHRAITLGLRLREIDVLTVQEDNRVGLADCLVLRCGTASSSTLFRLIPDQIPPYTFYW